MAETSEITKLLDPIGWRILAELQEDARIHFSELGRRVGLSTPAVIERVHRMEEAGLITGYRVEIDRQKVGLPVSAFIRVRVIGDAISRVIAVAREMPEVYECHHIAGEDTFLLKVCVPTSEALEIPLKSSCPMSPPPLCSSCPRPLPGGLSSLYRAC